MNVVSNISLWYLSMSFTKSIILNKLMKAAISSKVNLFANFHLNLSLFRQLFCFWETSKWSKINSNGLIWKFVMFINSLDQHNLPTSMNRTFISFKKQFFLQLSILIWPYFDHTFLSRRSKNEQKSMQMVSNESLWHLSIVLAKTTILNQWTEPLEA